MNTTKSSGVAGFTGTVIDVEERSDRQIVMDVQCGSHRLEVTADNDDMVVFMLNLREGQEVSGVGYYLDSDHDHFAARHLQIEEA